jgi:hypothetical protein
MNCRIQVEVNGTPMVARAQQALRELEDSARALGDSLDILGFDVEIAVHVKERAKRRHRRATSPEPRLHDGTRDTGE